MAKDHGSLAVKNNPHPFSNATTERQNNGGASSGGVGEVHGSKKAERIPAEKRYAGADKATLENSPGRASSDTSGE